MPSSVEKVTGSIAWHHGSVTEPRQPRLHGTAFAVRDPFPWPAFSRLVRQGESLGYTAVFLPEIGGRDALVALGELAGETEELRLGTGIIPMSSRKPMLTAMAAAAVHERSLGRLVLGIGTGPAVPGALDRLRELVDALRRLLAGAPVEVKGHTLRLSLIPDEPVPIWISALGPRAMRLAGEIADGVLLNWCTPERVGTATAEIRAGAEAAGRDAADVTVAVYVRASMGAGDEPSMRALQAAAGEYASYPAYARQFALMGLGEECRLAATAHAADRPEDVPQGLVRAVALPGDPSAARERLEAYREAGADLPVVYPVATPGDAVGSVARTLIAAVPV
jgi:alkanesulfonate monooxygenase SsuD/methylene tetrahydromethanopterin reductase-like flavin-dependent oxidoreductase (luciferase family)